MITRYGFRCMKYAEAYNMVLRSDGYFKLENGRMVLDRAGQYANYYGIFCEESTGDSVVDNAEVLLLLTCVQVLLFRF
jgi:hypothetical protein